MKPLLLHGSAIKASRIKLQELRTKFHPDNVMIFDNGEGVETILTNLNSISLFEGERLVILENPPEDFICNLFPVNCTLILWFDHQLKESSKILKSVKEQKGEMLYFPEGKEVSIFPFLDLLANKDKKAFLELFKLKESGVDIHYFITMVYYLLRILAATPKNAPPFVKQKIERQRKNFTLDKITNLYKDVLEIDFKIKIGLLEIPQAEFLLVNMFTK